MLWLYNGSVVPPPHRQLLDRVGAYQLLRRLGSGGMGETFVARDAAGEIVCLKTIRGDLAADPRYQRLFREEAQLHAQLHHENIVRVLAYDEDGGSPYLVLEMVEGISLEALLAYLATRASRAPLPAAVRILLGLTRGLAAAHAFTIEGRPQNVVHRDISPSNVLLGNAGEVKLSDFGIALFTARERRTTAGMIRGKLAYMSPEQMRGEPVDQRSDMFSLGVVAYELLSGSHPFRVGRDENDVMIAHRMLLDERAPLGQQAPWLPRALIDACEDLLKPTPQTRPADAAALAAALHELADADSTAALVRLVMGVQEPPGAANVETVKMTDAFGRLSGPPNILPSIPPSMAPPARERASTRPPAAVPALLERYLADLPDGLAAHPDCQAKGSLVRAYLKSRPLPRSVGYPAGLADLIAVPPVASAWVPEVSFLSVALLVRASHFDTDDAFLAWVKDLNAQLFRGQVYRVLMLVNSTRLLAAGASLRWRQFHTGTSLVAQHGSDASMTLSFEYPERLFLPLHVRLFVSAIEAAVEAAAGSATRTASLDIGPRSARALLRW
jgi:serine/threonine protein kinase